MVSKYRTFFHLVFSFITIAVLSSCDRDNPNEDQGGNNGDTVELENFTFKITNLKAGYVYVDFAPKNSSMTYFFNLVVKDDAKGKSDDEIFASDIENIEYIASQQGISSAELLSSELKSGNVKWRFTGLMQSSDYTIYAYGLDADGNRLSSIDRMDLTTPAVEKVDCDFEIVVSNIQTTSFTVTIAPSDDECAYFYDIFPAQYYEELCGSRPEGIVDFLPSYINGLAAQNQVDVPYTVSMVSTFGPAVEDFTSSNGLTPATNYFVFAVGIGADGTATTDPTVIQLTTASPETNTFTVVQGLTGHSDASYSVVPAHSESYVALFERSCYLKDNSGNYLSDDQIIDDILASRGGTIASSVYSGNATIYECPLVPDEDYCLLVFGYFAGEVTSGLTKAEFHTKAASPDTQQSFSIMSSSLQTNSFEVSYSPYYENRPFMANYMPMSDFIRLNGDLSDKASTNAAIRQYNDQVVEELYNNWSLKDYADKKEYLHRRLNTAYVSYKIEDLKASSDYLCYAIGMTADGTYTTDASVLKVTTKTVYNTPQISEILPSFSGSWLTLWFYINQDAPAKLYGCSSLVNDRSMYDLSDDEIKDYFYEGYDWDKGTQSPKRMWSTSEYFQSSVGNVQSGDVVYSAGILVGEDKDTYTVFRDAYEVK